MFRLATLAVLVLFAACDSGPGISWGDPELRITEGADQIAIAAEADSLEQPVVAQLFQTPDGGITFHLVTPAYAQTQVQGIPNQQVCAVPVGNLPLEPWNPCDITDPTGTALFYFEPGTKVGEACAEIRSVVDGEKVVTDTVCATVEPGAFAQGGFASAQSDIRKEAFSENSVPETYDPGDGFQDAFGNPIPYELQVSEIFVASRNPAVGNRWEVDLAPGVEYGATGTMTAIRTDDGSHLATASVTVVEGAVTGDDIFSWTLVFNEP